jgi:glucose-6-phosphate isomerase
MLDGAERAARHFLAAEPGANLPILAASALCLALDAGLPVHVFLPYADRLRKLAEWYVQLWGESLGKGGRGPTPLRGVGAVDQHSLLQLLVDGPRDKLVLFVEPAWDAPEPRIPHFPAAPRGYYPGGHRVAEVLLTEKRATEMALAESGVPSLTLACGALGLGALGELFQVLETVTALAGLMLGVNPFDQPGVELTKKYIHGLLGVPGFEEHRARFDAFRAALEPLEVSIDR